MTKLLRGSSELSFILAQTSRSSRRRFWFDTAMRSLTSMLDVFAILLVWYSATSVISGRFSPIFIGSTAVFTGLPATEEYALFAGLIIFILFFTKGALGWLTTLSLRRVALDIESEIVSKILSSNLVASFGGAMAGSADFPKFQNVLSQNKTWIHLTVSGYSILISDSILIASIFLAMLVINPLASTLVMGVTLLTALSTGIIVSRRITNLAAQERQEDLRWSEELSTAMQLRTQLSVRKQQKAWIQGIANSVMRSSKSYSMVLALHSLPRYVLELSVILSISVVVALSFLLGDLESNVAASSVVLAGSLRILGALLPIQNAVARMDHAIELGKFSRAYLSSSSPFSNEIQLDEKLVSEIEEFEKKGGEKVLFVVGRSGAGKTTLLLTVLAKLLQRGASDETYGYAGQDPVLLRGNSNRNLTLSFDECEDGDNELHELINELNMDKVLKKLDLADSATGEVDVRERLSGGELTRLEFLRAHSGGPQIIFLDEPTSGLDAMLVRNIARVINNADARYVIVSHDELLVNMVTSKRIIEIT